MPAGQDAAPVPLGAPMARVVMACAPVAEAPSTSAPPGVRVIVSVTNLAPALSRNRFTFVGEPWASRAVTSLSLRPLQSKRAFTKRPCEP